MATRRTYMTPQGRVVTVLINRTAMFPSGVVVSEQNIAVVGDIIEIITVGTWPAWSGKDLTVIANVIVAITVGSFNWLGQALVAKANTLISVTSGSFNWLGQNVQPFTDAIRTITAGAFNWLGQALTTSNNTIHTITAGVFNWLGQALTVVQVVTDLEQTVNDEKLNKLETALSKVGHISDLEVEWLQSLHVSVTSDNINTAWDQYFDSQLIPAGQRNDRAYAWLGGLGYTGTISKRWLDFWSAP